MEYYATNKNNFKNHSLMFTLKATLSSVQMEQNPMILAHDVLSLPFGCGKTITKE